VRRYLAGQPGVAAVHHLHIWPLGSEAVALTVHLVRPDDADHDRFIAATAADLEARFGIDHATFQIERTADAAHHQPGAHPH
jgi:cobalt-zinc-cadmium efflux system protein